MSGRGQFLLAAMFVAGCGKEPVGVRTPEPPAILSAAVTPNVHNVLSARAETRALRADSVAVRFRLIGGTVDSVTPAVHLDAGEATVPVLGLLPGREYEMRVVAYGERVAVVGEPMIMTTGMLPADLPRYSASGADASPGYVVFGAGRYGLVIDNTGRVVWYRAFPDGVGLSFMAEPNGRYLLRPQTPATGDNEPWIEVDPTGEMTRTLGCARGLQPRPHDIVLEDDGSYLLLCDETRTMDLTASGGVAAARVTGTVVQRIDRIGTLRFEWNPFDHFAITDVPANERTGTNVNWTHGNSLDVDGDGDLLVSFRNLGEITKIDGRTGAVIWRLGGLRNQFSFIGVADPAFARQHSVRVDPVTGALVLLDNLGDRSESRAERYLIDETSRSARLVQSYGSIPGVVTEIGGSVQPLPDGRTLVSFGTAGRVEEYDASGRVVWRMEGNPGYVFRAQRIRSLYAPGVGSAR
jgi:hypothetical protein